MKRHALIMSAALLSTALLLGCEDQGSGPVGPEDIGPQLTHKKDKEHGGKGGGGGGGGGGGSSVSDATVVLSGGMTTPSDAGGARIQQAVRIQRENRNILTFEETRDPDDNMISAFSTAIDLSSISECVVSDPDLSLSDDEVTDLLAKLTDTNTEQIRFWSMTVDKRKLGDPSDKHEIDSTWSDADGGTFSVHVGTTDLRPGPVKVTVTSDNGTINGDGTLVYSLGTVMIKNRTGPVSDHFSVHCDNTKTITVVVKRP